MHPLARTARTAATARGAIRGAFRRTRRAATPGVVQAYLGAVRAEAPTLAEVSDDVTLVRLGVALLVLAATEVELLGDGVAIATELGATREELGAVYAAAAALLSGAVFGVQERDGEVA